MLLRWPVVCSGCGRCVHWLWLKVHVLGPSLHPQLSATLLSLFGCSLFFFFFLSSLPGDVLVVLMWQFSSAVRWCEGKQGEAVEWAHHTDGEEGEGGSLWFGLH